MAVRGLGLVLGLLSLGGAEVHFLQAVWRHGDRAPSKLPYPLDPNTERVWPRGWGTLTTRGMRQMEELGAAFRARYVPKFLGRAYHPAQVYVKSSDAPRALSSAQSFLSGLYPPNASEQFDPAIRWQPVPVHGSPPQGQDALLRPTSFDCPVYRVHADLWEQQVGHEVATKYRTLFDFLGNLTGYGPNITFSDVSRLSSVNIELIHNLPVPAWLNKTWPEYDGMSTLECLMEIKKTKRLAEFAQLDLAYLRGGLLLGDWLRRLEVVTGLSLDKDAELEASKAVLYSAHDGTLLPIMNLLGVADGKMIPYAGALVLETHLHGKHEYTVQLYYQKKNSADIEGKHSGWVQLKMECGKECSVDEFIKVYRDRSILNKSQLYQACGLKPIDDSC